ncbi:hypothetical protein MHU86_4975 [Fragilaria crotonensis]|nr:hypothetical protein MHU86_4975 [Fragilaria crotonensis]
MTMRPTSNIPATKPQVSTIKTDYSMVRPPSEGWTQTLRPASSMAVSNGMTTTAGPITTDTVHKTIHAADRPESSPSSASSLPSSNGSKKPDLPLEWTQLSRQGTKLSDDFLDDCCEDPACRRRPRTAESSDGLESGNSSDKRSFVEGKAMFCLPELDSAWFQGYFTANDHSKTTNAKPWGLLAIQNTDMDDCLQCADGGYRELSLRLCRGPRRRDGDTTAVAPKPDLILSNITWTGGDMVQWRGKHVTFDTERILTGSKAVPLVEQYFGGLVQRLRESVEDCDDEDPLLELIPDVAIVLGTMRLSLPMDDSDCLS